ncbi:MAG TPA: hypothetical protein VNZ61_22415 [Roseomonas sp.]|nr:hypothetical protein [Roseomonas sp.]
MPPLLRALVAGALAAGAFLGSPARAAAPYQLELTVDGQSVTRGYDSISEVRAVLSTAGIQDLAPSYTDRSALNGTLRLRGLTGNVVMAPNSSAVRLILPAAGIDRTFTGATREESQRQALAFLSGKASEGAELEKIGEAFAGRTGADPVAGSPASLLGQSAMADHWAGTLPPGDIGGMAPREAGWHFGGGFEYLRPPADERWLTSYSLPFAASYTFGPDGPEAFLSAPLAMADLGGSQSYMGSAALGLRVPLVRQAVARWFVSPAFRYGAAGSEASGAVGASYGPSVTSDLRLALPASITLGIGNSISHYWTKPLDLGDGGLRYDLSNTFFRNGVSLSRPLGRLSERLVTLGGSVTDTRVAGSRFAVQNWQEYRLSLTLGERVPVRASLTYLDGTDGYRAWQLGLSLAF